MDAPRRALVFHSGATCTTTGTLRVNDPLQGP